MNCTGKNCIMQYDKVDPATCPCVPYCSQATPPKTNADRIRAMSDEELAIWIVHQTQGNKFDGYEEWINAWLKWLQEEVKDGST